MPNPRTQRPGRPHLQRDQQQWIFDYVIQQTGAVYHWWSPNEEPLPKEVRAHAMISKHLGKAALAVEAEAETAEADGKSDEAHRLYYEAARKFMRAQHPVFENNAEKQFLYGGLRRTFDKVIELNPYRIEWIEVPWQGTVVGGFLHLHPTIERAPLLFNIPGCDVTCESWPNPRKNVAHEHGWHTFSFDGPGLGRSNMRDIRLTDDNFEDAAKTIIDHLVTRPEIDGDQIIAYGAGAGGFWGPRLVALDDRIKAIATKSTYAPFYYLMNEDGPRWKQLFAFLTRSSSEAELDEILERATLNGYMEQITCPILMLTGEFNLRDPLEEVYAIFDQLPPGVGELWVIGDQFNKMSLSNGESLDSHLWGWLEDRLAGKPYLNGGEVLYVEPGQSPATAERKRHWYESGH